AVLAAGRRRWQLSIVAGSVVGAVIAYYFAAGASAPQNAPAPRPQVASFDSKVSAPAVALSRPELLPTVARDEDADAPAQTQSSSQHTKTTRLANIPEAAPVTPPPAGMPPPVVASPSPAAEPAPRAGP